MKANRRKHHGINLVLAAVVFLLTASGAFGNGLEDLAQKAIAMKKFAVAQRLYEKLADKSPEKLEYRLWVARLLSWQARFAESHSVYDRVLLQDSGNREALVGKAYAYMWNREYGKARTVLKRADESGKPSIAVALARANLYIQLNKIENALVSLEHARIINSSNAEIAALEKKIADRKSELSVTACSTRFRSNGLNGSDCVSLGKYSSGEDFVRSEFRQDRVPRQSKGVTRIEFRKQVLSNLSVRGRFERFSAESDYAATSLDLGLKYELNRNVKLANVFGFKSTAGFSQTMIAPDISIRLDNSTDVSAGMNLKKTEIAGPSTGTFSKSFTLAASRKFADGFSLNAGHTMGREAARCLTCSPLKTKSSYLSSDLQFSSRVTGAFTVGAARSINYEPFFYFRLSIRP